MEDTIVAISTALGNGSISIIRLSGDRAIDIVSKLFVGKNLTEVKSHTINYGKIKFEGNILDEVMVSVMRAPKTYTREDVVEINCHGGVFVTKSILRAVISSGARLSQPGEFTKRAFLNGRIDLSQSEAIMDLINAKSNMALKNSLNQMNGLTKNIINKIREKILREIAYIEACLDDPEHYELNNYGNTIRNDIVEIQNEINKLISDSIQGALLREGVNCAIVGLPNAGKSSLLNTLANREKAIVTDIAGTTRDIIEEQIIIGDLIINMIDTAGIRETQDIVEKIGVERSLKSIEDASLVLYVIDSSKEITEEDIKIFESLKNKESIIILNKIDKNTEINFSLIPDEFDCVVPISIVENKNIDLLKEKIANKIIDSKLLVDDELYVANERQRELLISANESIKKVIETIDLGISEDFLSIDLTQAYIDLGKILGEEIEEDIINKIFKDFCMGK